MNNIKETPEYKLSKIAVIKKLYEDKYEANKLIADLSGKLGNSINKIKELEEKNASNGSHTNNVPSGALPVELEPSVENNNDNQILELKSEIEGHFKINNELQQENEELKNNWSNSCNKYCKEIKELKKDYEELKKSNIKVYNKEEMNKEINEENLVLKEENKILKEKLCHIEATMKAFSVLVNMSVN